MRSGIPLQVRIPHASTFPCRYRQAYEPGKWYHRSVHWSDHGDDGRKSFNQPEETNTPEKLRMEGVTIRGLTFRRITVAPGWQWSRHLKPIQKTASCQKDHILYIVSRRIRVRMDDGTVEEFGPGDMGSIPPRHDGWTVGNVPAVWIEIPH
jgi:hypothetical protein